MHVSRSESVELLIGAESRALRMRRHLEKHALVGRCIDFLFFGSTLWAEFTTVLEPFFSTQRIRVFGLQSRLRCGMRHATG